MVATASAATLQGYSLPQPVGGGLNLRGQGFQQQGFISGSSGISSGQSGFTFGGQVSGPVSGSVSGPVAGPISCQDGHVALSDGSCVEPIVRRNLFVYRAPAVSPIVGPRPDVPPPRVEHNVVFIHTPNNLFGNDPVVVPPPQQKNVIYVLNKRPEIDPSVLEFPPPEQVAPEIFFVNYADGENPQLPSGGDLQSALAQAAESRGGIIGQPDGTTATTTTTTSTGTGDSGTMSGITSGSVTVSTGTGDQTLSPLYGTP